MITQVSTELINLLATSGRLSSALIELLDPKANTYKRQQYFYDAISNMSAANMLQFVKSTDVVHLRDALSIMVTCLTDILGEPDFIGDLDIGLSRRKETYTALLGMKEELLKTVCSSGRSADVVQLIALYMYNYDSRHKILTRDQVIEDTIFTYIKHMSTLNTAFSYYTGRLKTNRAILHVNHIANNWHLSTEGINLKGRWSGDPKNPYVTAAIDPRDWRMAGTEYDISNPPTRHYAEMYKDKLFNVKIPDGKEGHSVYMTYENEPYSDLRYSDNNDIATDVTVFKILYY